MEWIKLDLKSLKMAPTQDVYNLAASATSDNDFFRSERKFN